MLATFWLPTLFRCVIQAIGLFAIKPIGFFPIKALGLFPIKDLGVFPIPGMGSLLINGSFPINGMGSFPVPGNLTLCAAAAVERMFMEMLSKVTATRVLTWRFMTFLL